MITHRTAAIIALVAVLCFIMAGVTMCVQRDRIAGQKRDIQVARDTGKALDTVTTKTEAIRSEQGKKADEVSKIEGSDQRLPDGFAADLERVRRGERH